MIEWFNHSGTLWADYFGTALLQNTVFLGAVFIALRFLKNASARILYGVSLLGLLKCFIPTLLPVPFTREPIVQSQFFGSFFLSNPAKEHPALPTVMSGTPQTEFAGLVFSMWLLGQRFLSWRRLHRR
ncbi:hypothetical protein JXJ21_09100 [candidate division KSB1 bacterium]|nr:hypothetical protein [candidate division KSB1 bacterium]